MVNSRLSRLLALSDREFRARRGTRVQPHFKALKVHLGALDTDWERQRGAAARMMGSILWDDRESLLQKVAADPPAFADAIAWLRREAQLLRRTAGRMDQAASRLSMVLGRHRERSPVLASDAGATAPRPERGIRLRIRGRGVGERSSQALGASASAARCFEMFCLGRHDLPEFTWELCPGRPNRNDLFNAQAWIGQVADPEKLLLPSQRLVVEAWSWIDE